MLPINCCISSTATTCSSGRENCCKPKKQSFRYEPEFQVRLPPPQVPYPSKFSLISTTSNHHASRRIAPRCYEAQLPTMCESASAIETGECDSRYCLKLIQQILEGPELQWESVGEDVLTIWSFYTRNCPAGMFLTEIDLMANILLQLGLNFNRLSYAKEFLNFIHAHLVKGLRVRSVGEMVETKRLAYGLTILGEAFCLGVPTLQTKIVGILGVWLAKATGRQRCSFKPQRKCLSMEIMLPQEEKGISKLLLGQIFLESLYISKLPKILGDYVKDGAYTSCYCSLLQLLRHFCDCSNPIRCQLKMLALLDPLLLKLCLEDSSNKILSLNIDLIYALMGLPAENEGVTTDENIPSPHEGTFQFLLTRLFLQFKLSSSKLQLNLRNDTAFIVAFLCRRLPQLGKCFGRYAQAIAALVSSNIFGATSNLHIPYVIDSTPEDTELLKYLVWMLDLIFSSGSSLHMIEEYHLVEALIAVLMGPSKLIDAMARMSSTESLEAATWSALISISKKSPKAFLVPDGAPAMLNYLKIYNAGGSEVDNRLASMFTHLFRSILSHEGDRSEIEPIIRFMHENKAMTIFVEGIHGLTNKNCSAAEEPMLTNFLLCCAAMGQYDMLEKEEFMYQSGVRIIVRLIRKVIHHPSNERHLDPVLHIAIAECVLKCVANSTSSLEQFLVYEGPLRILDLLEINAGPSTLHMMNCILELCEYPRCMDQLLYWSRRAHKMNQHYVCGDKFKPPWSRMPNAIKPKMGESMDDIIFDYDHSYSALLCELWREEETRWEVARDSEGCISSLEFPLMSSFAQSFQRGGKAGSKKPKAHPGPSGLDLLDSIRPKIFLLVKKITEAANSEAELFDGLGVRNQLTMQIIINFLDLKRSEIWIEMWKEFKRQEFELVPTDARVMDTLAKISRNKVSAVIDTQRYLIQRDKERDEIHERELYELIQKCHLQDHLKALREADYIARTTNYAYLIEKRLWQKTELQRAVMKASASTRIHRTTDGPLNITVWPVRTKIVDSEPHDAEPHPSEILEFPENVNISDSIVSFGPAPSDSSGGSLFSLTAFGADHWTLHPSAVEVKNDYDDGATPDSAKGGVYQISAEMLRKALQLLLARQKKRTWLKSMDDSNYWKVRAKWKPDWYPEESLRVVNFSGGEDPYFNN